MATLGFKDQFYHHLYALDLPGPKYNPTQDKVPGRSQCKICGIYVGRKRDLRRHMNIHDESNWFGCGDCNKRFHRKDMLVRHRRKEHNT
jgi:uncharacterized Zn-finger protein